MSQVAPSAPGNSGFDRLLRGFPRWAGVAIVLIGLLVIIAWLAPESLPFQYLPKLTPMHLNTAFGLVLCGVGLILLTTRQGPLARWPGGVAGLIGLLTLIELFSRHSLGLDNIFAISNGRGLPACSVRGSPMSALCLLLAGVALTMCSCKRQGKWPLTITSYLACAVAALAGERLMAFVFQVQTSEGFGLYVRMAPHSALAFLLLGTGLLAWAARESRRENFDFFRRLPITATLILVPMIMLVFVLSYIQARHSVDLRRKNYLILDSAQMLMGRLADVDRGLHGYVLTGQSAALVPYQNATNNLPAQLNELFTLTRNDPDQEQRLKAFATDFAGAIAYSHQLLDTRAAQGLEASAQLESTGRGFAAFNRARADLQAFVTQQDRLLNEHASADDENFSTNQRLLFIGRALVLCLLVLANWIASREISRRRQIEAELKAEQDLLRQFIAHSPAAIAMLDAQMRYLQTSERWLKDYHLKGKDITGRSHYEVFPDVPARWKEIYRRVLAGAVERWDEDEFPRTDGSIDWLEWEARPWYGADGQVGGLILFTQVITDRKQRAAEREKIIAELQKALAEVKTLTGLIPICGWCKSVRTDSGYWQSVEQYVKTRTDATFTHGLCPDCVEKMKADIIKANVKPDAPASQV